jgi:vancomycin resistance protein YoaR
MLDGLKKKLGITPNVEKEAVTDKLKVVMSVTETDEYKELLEGFKEQSTQLDAALAQVLSLTAQLEQFAEAKAAAEAEAKKVKMDARMASLSKEVGDERAKKVLAATEGMDDAAFTAIADALKMSADTEAKSTLFTEQGASEEVTPEARNTESEEMKLLKEKYNKSA